MKKAIPLLLCCLLTLSNCEIRKIAKADESMALTHKLIWDYINTFDDLYPDLKPPRIKYKQADQYFFFSEEKDIIYAAEYHQLNRPFKKQLAKWAEGLPSPTTAQQLYEDWYLILEMTSALSWYLMDHANLHNSHPRKRIQNIYILSWVFLREQNFYGKKEADWIEIIRHINKNAKEQFEPKALMMSLNSAFTTYDKPKEFYLYFSTICMLKSHQMAKKIKMNNLLKWFEQENEKMEKLWKEANQK